MEPIVPEYRCGHEFMMSGVSLCVLKHHHCKGITLQAAAC